MRKYIILLCVSTLLLCGVIYCGVSAYFYSEKENAANASALQTEEIVYSKALSLILSDDIINLDRRKLLYFETSIVMPKFLTAAFTEPSVSVTPLWYVDDLKVAVEELYSPSKNAQLLYDACSGWQLYPEVIGNDFDVNLIVNLITNADVYSDIYVDTTEESTKPYIVKDDLKLEYDRLAVYNDFRVEYTSGDSLNGIEMYNSYDSPQDANFDSYNLTSLKNRLLQSYDTSSKIVEFTTTDGEVINVPYVTYGYSLNWEKEEEFLREAISTASTTLGREPYLTGYDNLTNTYIEISLTAQHVWHYVDGELCCDSDCVTGTKNKRDTPTGVYYISECIPGKYLRGDDYVTWVNRWMRLTNSGVGLHDAYWRSKFGGSIYTYDGSHGCINLPSAYAYSLFDEVKNGYPVIIY